MDSKCVPCSWLDVPMGQRVCIRNSSQILLRSLYIYLRFFRSQITIRSVDYSAIWNHFLNSSVTHYCAAPTVQVSSSSVWLNTANLILFALADWHCECPRKEEASTTNNGSHCWVCANCSPHRRTRKDWHKTCSCLWVDVCAFVQRLLQCLI
jgi:hypothetical protein